MTPVCRKQNRNNNKPVGRWPHKNQIYRLFDPKLSLKKETTHFCVCVPDCLYIASLILSVVYNYSWSLKAAILGNAIVAL